MRPRIQAAHRVPPRTYLDARLENNGTQGAFLPRTIPPPVSVSIGQEDVNCETRPCQRKIVLLASALCTSVLHVGFVFAFGLEDKFLEDGVIPSYNADFEFFRAAIVRVVLFRASYP